MIVEAMKIFIEAELSYGQAKVDDVAGWAEEYFGCRPLIDNDEINNKEGCIC
ncbi:hypothetical protein ACLOJK_039581 [Asimina triloba]